MKTIRGEVEKISPYEWETSSASLAKALGLKEKDILRFDMNTSPFAPAMSLPKKLKISEYPDPSYENLILRLAKYAKTTKNRILVGAGADEIIDIIARTFLEKGEAALISTPTYSMFRISVELAGGVAIGVPRGKNYSLDPDVVIAKAREAKAKLIFVCNPNSPTGNSTPFPVLEKIAKNSDSILIVDEAYYEFCKKSAFSSLGKLKNVIIIRTLSKAFGLAGIRVGYAIAPPRLAEAMNKVRPPNSISMVSLYLAEQALAERIPEMRNNVETIVKERKRLSEALGNFGLFVYPSVTNFLFVRTSPDLASKIYGEFLKKGLVIRDFSNKELTKGCLRITVRSRAENDCLLRELKSILDSSYESLIFDIDGVLVDVSKSYREAIKRTASKFLRRNVTSGEVEEMKSTVGFNNDWDAAYALVTRTQNPMEINRTSTLYSKIKSAFQEAYLGKDGTGGLIEKEKPIVSESTLARLKRNGVKLGVVTGRPREEALIALAPFLGKYFDERNIIALEDCDEEKPSPKPLLLLMGRMGSKNSLYVGDSPSDVAAANSARIRIAVVGADIGGDFCLRNVNEIFKVVGQ
ncbi:MAG: histidinol-phosphate transaminase [Candidatus Micrarchaeota archaeon]